MRRLLCVVPVLALIALAAPASAWAAGVEVLTQTEHESAPEYGQQEGTVSSLEAAMTNSMIPLNLAVPPPFMRGVLLAAAFMTGHAKPDKNAKVSITTPLSHAQLGKANFGQPGCWGDRVPAPGGTYLVTARVPHAVCSSATLSIPGATEGQQDGGEYKVRISCVPAP